MPIGAPISFSISIAVVYPHQWYFLDPTIIVMSNVAFAGGVVPPRSGEFASEVSEALSALHFRAPVCSESSARLLALSATLSDLGLGVDRGGPRGRSLEDS